MNKAMVSRLGRLSAGVALAGVLASAVIAQTVPDGAVPQAAGLDLPANLQIFGKQDPNVRKATAIVNGSVITGTDVDQRVGLIASLNEVKLGEEDLNRLKLQVLRQLIDETLQIQEARTSDIAVTATEINQSFETVARRQFKKSGEELSAYLRTVGSSERSLKRQIEGELAWNRFLRRKVTPFVNVSEEEVKSILERLQASQGTEEFHLKEIYLSAPPERAAEVRAAMTKMIEQMRGGAPFEYFARNFSEASTKAVGGDLDWVRISTLPTELQSAAQGLQVGQIAGPIEVSGGLSILYLIDKRQVLTADPRDARLALRQLTVKFAPGTTQAQASERAGAFAAVLKNTRGCGEVGKAAAQLGAEIVDNDAVTVRSLPPQLQEIMLTMQVGQTTPPFGNPEDGVRALVLCGRDDPKQASLPTAEAVQSRLEDQRVNLRAQRMLRDLRRDAIVEYR